MLKINLRSFDDRKEFEFLLKRGDISFENDEIVIKDGMKLYLTLTKDGESSIIAEGRLSGFIKATCGRCLEEFDSPVETSFAAVFREKGAYTEEDEEAEAGVYENNTLDIYSFVRDTLILEAPVKPLCGDSCEGICKVCGKNLNKDKCGCEKQENKGNNPFSGL